MKQRTRKRVLLVTGVLTFVGGLTHLLQPFGVNLLSYVPVADWIQVLAGASTVTYVTMKWN